MKKIKITLCLLALALVVPMSARANLSPADASRLLSILHDSGLQAPAGKIEIFDLLCVAYSYGDNDCMVSTDSQDPGAHRVQIPRELSSEFWSLIKRAGAKQSVSEVSDGTAGRTVIMADSVSCATTQAGFEECDLVAGP